MLIIFRGDGERKLGYLLLDSICKVWVEDMRLVYKGGD